MFCSKVDTFEDEHGPKKVVKKDHGAQEGNHKEKRKELEEDVRTDEAKQKEADG